MFNQRPPPNSMSKSAQFSFAADLFMLQAILRSEDGVANECQLEYFFPWSCYRQVIEWILENGNQVGVSEFENVKYVHESATHVKIIFPNELEQDKMHKFFEMFNYKRKQAQGVDQHFPPMPDLYEGGSKPDLDSIRRYIYSIEEAFDGDSNLVDIPVGPNREVFKFHF